MDPALLNAPLSDAEIDELDRFLLYEPEIDDCMTLDMLDGYLHALAIGPTAVPPTRWMPRVWAEDFSDRMPPVKDADALRRIVSLITRLSHSIVARLEDPDGSMIVPLWSTFSDGDGERDDARIWACGFIAGMNPCEEDFGPGQHAPTRTPADREKLSLQTPDAVLAIHQYWLPHRRAVDERHVAGSTGGKVGRNDLCRCGSGRKFNRCCGAAAQVR